MVAVLVSHLRLRRVQTWAVLLAGLAAGLAFVPLFNILSFEFCFAMSIACSLASAHLGSVRVAHARARDEGLLLALRSQGSSMAAFILHGVAANLSLLALPLAIISLNALRVKNCNYLDGLAFFIVLPVLSSSIATCAGMLWGMLVSRPALATLASLATIILSAAWGVYRFYAAPPIFGFDPFVGYFPGTLYDQEIAVRAPLLWFRLQNLLTLTGLVLAAGHVMEPGAVRLRLSAFRASAVLTPAAAVCLIAGAALFLFRAELGFAIDKEHIARALGGVRYTTHFAIHHPASMAPAQVELLAQDHEFRYAQLAGQFGAAPPRITSFIFESGHQKRRLMGANRTFVAKPWRNEVYLQQAGFPHEVLKHELAHVFAGLHGDDVFKVSLRWRRTPVPHPLFNAGLIEGIAVAADWRSSQEMTVHQLAAALVAIDLAPPLKPLFGYGFLTGAANRSYTLAGSFCKFLIQRQGFAKLAAVYASGGDFAGIYGSSLETLLARWRRWIVKVSVPPAQVQLARERYRRPGVISRVCSHEVANLQEEAAALQATHEHERAARLREQICQFDPGEPLHMLRWMKTEGAGGQHDRALAIGSRVLEHPALSKPLRRHVLSYTGDLNWLAGRPGEAGRLYRAASAFAASAPGRRILHLKLWSLGQRSEVRRLVLDYLVQPPEENREAGRDVHLAHLLNQALPKSGLGQYLVAKQLVAHDHHQDGARAMKRAIARGLPNLDFVIEAHRVLGRSQYINRDCQGSIATFERLSARADLPAGARLEALDWLSRNRWRSAGLTPAVPTVITPMIKGR